MSRKWSCWLISSQSPWRKRLAWLSPALALQKVEGGPRWHHSLVPSFLGRALLKQDWSCATSRHICCQAVSLHSTGPPSTSQIFKKFMAGELENGREVQQVCARCADSSYCWMLFQLFLILPGFKFLCFFFFFPISFHKYLKCLCKNSPAIFEKKMDEMKYFLVEVS